MLETIDSLGQLVHHLTNNVSDSSQQISISNMTGSTDMGGKGGASVNFSSSLGSFGVVASNVMTTFSFCLPLLGVANCEKMWPLHSHRFEIEQTYAPLADWTRDLSGAANTTATSYTLSNLEIIGETVVLEEQAMSAVLKAYPIIRLRSESWLYNSATQLAASSGAGTYDLQLSASLKGVKRLLWSCAPSDAIDKRFAGVNPNLQNWYCVIGNRAYPQQPIEASKLAYDFLEVQKSSGSIFSGDHCGNLTRKTFSSASTAYLGAGVNDVLMTHTLPQ